MDVRLRAPRQEDSEPLFALEADPRVARMAAFGAPRDAGMRPAHGELVTTTPGITTRILEKAGFRVAGREVAFAPARREEIAELVLSLGT